MKIKITELKELALKIILQAGNLSEEQAEKVLEVLLYADMTGRMTQGVIKLVGGQEALQSITPKGEPIVLKETKASVHYDCNGNPSQLVTKMATEKVIEKCSEVGIAIAGVKGIHSSNSSQAYYVREIAQAGFVGVMVSRSPAAVAPHGGKEPMYGTNPIGFGYPTNGEPLLFDMATSAITWFGLVEAKAGGKNIPADLAIDEAGNVTSDPEEAMDGAILPFDRSYKGAGLAMMVELLGGPLVGAAYCTYDVGADWGALLLAIDPELFRSKDEFVEDVSKLCEIVRNSAPRNEESKVTIPGDRSIQNYKKALETGEIEISKGVYNALLSELKK